MARVRLNKVIELLEQRKPAFGLFQMDLTREAARIIGDSAYDFCIWDMEHGDFDFVDLQICLQFMLNRRRIAEKGSIQPDVVPLGRIAANARERNEWQFKQILDCGVYGVIFAHAIDPDDIIAASRACRYPCAPTGDLERHLTLPGELFGHRGANPSRVYRYWGVDSPEEYLVKADVWPANPEGEILLIPLIEDVAAVDDIDRILKETKGLISAIFYGEGDLSVSMGIPLQFDHPDLKAATRKVLEAAKKYDVPCACLAGAHNVAERVEQGFLLLTTIGIDLPALDIGFKAAGRA